MRFTLPLLALLIIAACATEAPEQPQEFNLSCTFDDDCTAQQTSCNGCACPIAVNKNSARSLTCPPSNGPFCDLYCAPATPRCIGGACTMTMERDGVVPLAPQPAGPPPVEPFSCVIDSDCAVKDVHSCCGYYPRCVHRDYVPDVEAVRAACARSGVASVCGYPEIAGCVCQAGVCVGVGRAP
jgi:hypothetical protein